MNLFTTLFTGLAGFGYRNSRLLILGSLVVLLCSPLLLEGLRVEADAAKVIPYEDSFALAYRENRALFGEANRLVIELRYGDVGQGVVNRFTDSFAETVEAWDDIPYLDYQPFMRERSEEHTLALRAALLNSDPTILEPIQPRRQFTFRFSPRMLSKVRVVQTATDPRTPWRVEAVRLFAGRQELLRRDAWRLTADPNPWEVDLAFDNVAATRWRSWQAMTPGVFVEIDLGGVSEINSVVVECSDDQDVISLAVEGSAGGEAWQRLGTDARETRIEPPPGLRRAAGEEVRRRGIRYLLVPETEYGAADYHDRASE